MERTPTPTRTRELLDRFADEIVSHGIALVPAALFADLVETGRAVDASPIALAVLVDPTEPAVVRERAFDKVAIRIVGRDSDLLRVQSTRRAMNTGMTRSVFA